MIAALVLLGVGLSLLGRPSAAVTTRRRLSSPRLRQPVIPRAASADRRRGALGPKLAWLGCMLAGVAVAGWPGLIAGALIGGVVAALVSRLSNRATAPSSIDPSTVPMVLDLLAAALRSGAPAPAALMCVAEGAPEPIRAPLRRAAALLRLGATPVESFAHLQAEPALSALGTVVARSADSGIRLADGLTRRARGLREELRLAELARAQRTGVFALLPLGLCFLPAFVCLGIVPIIAGVASQVFSGH